MLVTANNFMQLFFGWEGVGLASYLLIGFWYKKPSANAAAIKAFIVNRVGDFGFALGIMGIYLLSFILRLFGASIPVIHQGGPIGIGRGCPSQPTPSLVTLRGPGTCAAGVLSFLAIWPRRNMSRAVPDWLEEWLGLSQPGSGQGTAWRLDSVWNWPPWLTFLFCLL